MSYCIDIDWSEKFEGEGYENLSWSETEADDKLLSKTEQFGYFYDDFSDEKDEDETEEEHRISLVDKFKETQAFDELRETYVPMMNYMHILQDKPFEEQVQLVEKYAGICVVIEMEDLDVCGLALTGGGMDLSDNIELAYYLTDGVSPVISRQVMSLGSTAEKLLEHCRKVVKETGRVCHNEVKSFLGEQDDN